MPRCVEELGAGRHRKDKPHTHAVDARGRLLEVYREFEEGRAEGKARRMFETDHGVLDVEMEGLEEHIRQNYDEELADQLEAMGRDLKGIAGDKS